MRRLVRTVGGVLEGRNLLWYADGKIAAIFYYHAGQQEGPQRWFYPNGRVKRIRYVRHNQPNGKSYEFYPQGHPDFIDSLVDNKRQGRYVEFFDRPPYGPHIRGRFAIVNGEERLVEFAEYDTAGHVVQTKRLQ